MLQQFWTSSVASRPAIVKVVRPAFIVAKQQQKQKTSPKQASLTNEGGSQDTRASTRYDQQLEYNNDDQNGSFFGFGEGDCKDNNDDDGYSNDSDDDTVEVYEPTASEIRQHEHEEHQKRRRRRSRHRIETSLSQRTKNKMQYGRLGDATISIGNGKFVYSTPDYSPINRERFHETDFTPNTGSPPLKMKKSLVEYFELESWDSAGDEEDEDEGPSGEDDDLHWYMQSYYEDLD